MKAKDIFEFETGSNCFGPILTVNSRDYMNLSKEEVVEFILDMFDNDINSNSIIRETFQNCLEHLQYDVTDTSSSICDQCGDWNSYAKNVRPDE